MSTGRSSSPDVRSGMQPRRRRDAGHRPYAGACAYSFSAHGAARTPLARIEASLDIHTGQGAADAMTGNLNHAINEMLHDDPDPTESREWLESISAVIQREGPERAHQLLEGMVEMTRRAGAHLPFSPTTEYINTIPPHLEAK